MKSILYYIALGLFTLCMLNQECPAQSQPVSHANHDAAIQIMAEDYAFQAPNEIASGWTTIQYENHGNEQHFLFVAKLPEGKSFEDYSGEVLPPFNEIWYGLREDELTQEQAVEKFGDLPEWFWSVTFMGGTGIIQPGEATEITLNLPPGEYALECYMKTEEGEMHNVEGMLRKLTVTEELSGLEKPRADIDITLSNYEMNIDGDLTPGPHTFAVHVEEQSEVGFGHSVHVVRTDANPDIDSLLQWMNFMEKDGLRTPGPFEFAGGMNILPAGSTGFFKADLEPGHYVFVSEYTGHLGVLQEVTVR